MEHVAPEALPTPSATWTEFLGLPAAENNQGDRADNGDISSGEEDVGGEEGHHYPARDRRPPDRFSPDDFRHTKA